MPMFALMDCNNFYASCERVFNPKLNGKPIVILSNNDGCIVARSNEAKQLGIPMGAPYFQWRKHCEQHQVYVFSSNYELYGDMSQRVMSATKQLCPHLEIYSIDEAFLMFNHISPAAYSDYAAYIRQTITTWTGIPVSIGIGPSKTLAKLANHIAKKLPQGVFNLSQKTTQDAILSQYGVQDLWGIGKKLSQRLIQLNIHTAKALRDANPKILRAQFSVTMEQIIQELKGISCIPLASIQPRKQIISSRSFGKRVTSISELEEALSHYTATACAKLRRQQSVANGISIFISTTDHIDSVTHAFPTPTDDTRYIISIAKQCLPTIYRKDKHYKKAGIILLDLSSAAITQTDLFNETAHPKEHALMQAVDNINQLMGKESIFFCAEGTQRAWQMRRDKRSPRYTTQWHELAIVK